MAAVASDSLFSVSQSFFSPDILQKISTEINQPIEKTKAGLKSVIPTLLMGIVNKGSTQEGAETLVNMASKHTTPMNVSADSDTLKEGNEFLTGIFGSNLSNTVSSLGATTGMNTGSISKMLGMAAPLVMGAIGSKIKNEKMSASGLMSFLGQQKSSLMALIPSGLGGLTGMQNRTSETSVWPKVVLLGLVVAAVIWLLNTFAFKKPAPLVMETPTASLPAAVSANAIQSIGSLQAFMNSSAAAGTLRRFRFEHLNFQTGTTTLMNGAENELNQIAFTMKTFPNATARVEGFTDNTGNEAVNQTISIKRAQAVKNELVSRGVRADRILAVGMGQRSPLASNDTAQGRAENRRIEFVVKK
jgi:outer membrane protein OmpA-like peptidoglycan-associated protein